MGVAERDDELARRAADPATPLTTLQLLARDHPELRPVIAANPSTYPALLGWLGELGVPEVDAALRTRGAGAPADVPTPVVAPDEAPTEVHPPVIRPAAAPTAPRAHAAPPSAVPPARPAPAGRRSATDRPAGNDRRRAAVLGVGGLVVLALVIALVAMLTTRGGQDSAAPDATSPAGETATEEPSTTGTPDGVAAAQAALAGLAQSSTCTDPSTDARVFTEFGVAASVAGAWSVAGADDDVIAALTGLQTSCGPAHAVQVNNALLAGAQTPPALVTTLREAPRWVEPVRAAPADAQDLADFSSPSGNIVCVLGVVATTCTIDERAFSNPPECVDGPVTIVVPLGGEARVDCAAPAARSAATLGYGTSTTSGYFACTSERDGVSCWSTLTGRGFSLARAQFALF
ncbi:MAG: variant leucine-rich repeat-containing protein [Georgenia sp.]